MESMSVSVGNTHLLAVKQFFPLTTDNMWTMKFDADGKVLKRHEHGGDDEHRVPKRVRITHKQPDNRADLKLTDDAVSKRVTHHHHPVPHVMKLRRRCMFYLVELRSRRCVKA